MTDGMRHIALLLEYDGTRYHGFQVQNNAITVQGELESALQQMLGEAVRVRGASRTDTGVHARGQVASFYTNATHPVATFVAGLNFYLPSDISVRAACEVDPEVDVRRYAVSRRYRYTILNQPTPSPLARLQSYHVRHALDVQSMDAAAQSLVGTHDFASFSGPPSYKGQPTERTLLSAHIRQAPSTELRVSGNIYFDIVAESFLPQQVRRTVAQLIRIGKGKAEPVVLQHFLDNPVLGSAWEAAAPHALRLEEITYPEGLLLFTEEEQSSYAPPMVLSGVS